MVTSRQKREGFGQVKGNILHSIVLRVPMVFNIDKAGLTEKSMGGFETLGEDERERFTYLAVKTVNESCKVTGFRIAECTSYYTEWLEFEESFLNIRLTSTDNNSKALKAFGIGCLECFLSLISKEADHGRYYCPTFHQMDTEHTKAFGIDIPFNNELLRQGRAAAVCTLMLTQK